MCLCEHDLDELENWGIVENMLIFFYVILQMKVVHQLFLYLCFTVEKTFFDCCGCESSQESKLKYQYMIIFYNYNSISRLVEMYWNVVV